MKTLMKEVTSYVAIRERADPEYHAKMTEYRKNWVAKNAEEHSQRMKEYLKDRYKNDTEWRTKMSERCKKRTEIKTLFNREWKRLRRIEIF